MERQEKIERLTEHLKVSPEEAAKALDAAGGDLLDAALLLERGKNAGERAVHTHSTAAAMEAAAPPVAQEAAKKEGVTGDKVTEIITALLLGLVTHPILNGVCMEQKGKRIAVIPGGILVALFLVRWWVVVGLATVGLFAGWHFTWTGPQWGNAQLNAVWALLESKVTQFRESMKTDRPHG